VSTLGVSSARSEESRAQACIEVKIRGVTKSWISSNSPQGSGQMAQTQFAKDGTGRNENIQRQRGRLPEAAAC